MANVNEQAPQVQTLAESCAQGPAAPQFEDAVITNKRRFDYALMLIIVAMGAFVSWLTIPRLPGSVCFDDAGDLQLASATLGIAHPPGYPGYVTIGYLLTLIPGVDPAYVVSLACFVAGLSILAACVLLQVHLGVSHWLAAAVALAVAAHPRFWTNLRAPEVYVPTLALLAWSVWLLVRYARTDARWRLAFAVLLFGLALANRPPVLFATPFFILAWLYARKQIARPGFTIIKDLAWMIPLAAAPTAYSFGYLYVRDHSDTCYNYIENHNEETQVLPDNTDGLQAKVRRVTWHMSGEQFREYMGTDWKQFVGKLRWLETQMVFGSPFTDLVVSVFLLLGAEPPSGRWYPRIDVYFLALLAVIGLVIMLRRNRVAGTLVLGLAVSCAAFVLVYNVFGQAADLLPLLFAKAVCIGTIGSTLFPRTGHWVRQLFSIMILCGAAVLFASSIPSRSPITTGVDATAYLREMDLATFPGPAVICANWTKSVPLRYAQCVQTQRRDIHMITSGPGLWKQMALQTTDRPVYVADPLRSDCDLTSFRNVYLLTCPEP